jgi:putative Mg2+ transporter-C (MgtC) family protein
VAAVGLAVGGGMFLASVAATVLALVILVLARPVKKRLFPNRKARFVTLIIDQNTSLAELRSEVDASNLSLDRIVVRPGLSRDKDSAELVLGKGSDEEDLLSLTNKLRRISGVHEVNSLLDGTAHSKN